MSSAPSRVTDADVWVLDKSIAVITWSEPDWPNGPVDGYEITVSRLDEKDYNWTDLTNSSYEVGDLSPDTDYTARIVAYNLNDDLKRLKSETVVIECSTRHFIIGPSISRAAYREGNNGSAHIHLGWRSDVLVR